MMSTGTGLVLLGVWICAAAMWHSRNVAAIAAVSMTAIAIALTVGLH